MATHRCALQREGGRFTVVGTPRLAASSKARSPRPPATSRTPCLAEMRSTPNCVSNQSENTAARSLCPFFSCTSNGSPSIRPLTHLPHGVNIDNVTRRLLAGSAVPGPAAAVECTAHAAIASALGRFPMLYVEPTFHCQLVRVGRMSPRAFNAPALTRGDPKLAYSLQRKCTWMQTTQPVARWDKRWGGAILTWPAAAHKD